MTNYLLSDLKYGHTILSGVAPTFLSAARQNIQLYFSQPIDYKNQHVRTNQRELGYRNLGHKELFIVRERALPSELTVCAELASALHQLSLRCLELIAAELQLDAARLFDLVDTDGLPANGVSSSLLRILNYATVSSPLQSDRWIPASVGMTHNGVTQLDLNTTPASDIHEDLGLLTLICHTGVPALEIYDFRTDQGWLDIETLQQPDDIIVMAGESLSLISNAYYLPATHRVRTPAQPRLSILYQLRCKQDAVLDSRRFETAVTGKFSKPFCMSGGEFLEKEISKRKSVSGSY